VLGIALLVAIPLLTPLVVEGVGGAIRPRGFGLGYSLRSLAARLQTTSFAVASLAIAISMLIGITLLIGSFPRTVEGWMGTPVRAAVDGTTPAWGRAGWEAALDPALVERLRAWPGVRFADRLRRLSAYLGDRRVSVVGIDMRLPHREERFVMLAGEPAAAV